MQIIGWTVDNISHVLSFFIFAVYIPIKISLQRKCSYFCILHGSDRERGSTYGIETVELRVHSTSNQTHSLLFSVIMEHFKCLSPHYTYGNRDLRIETLTQAKAYLQFLSLQHQEMINDNTEYNPTSESSISRNFGIYNLVMMFGNVIISFWAFFLYSQTLEISLQSSLYIISKYI